MLIDAHLHCSGRERADDVLRSLDEAGVERAVLLVPFLSEGFSLHDAASLRRANVYLAELVRGHADRLHGFAVINPALPGASEDLRHAIEALGLTGLKLVPSGWYPYDARAHEIYAEASALGIPILFHSGIFIDGRSGRFCRPTFYEYQAGDGESLGSQRADQRLPGSGERSRRNGAPGGATAGRPAAAQTDGRART
ncbi:MAG TPA: amidohydrolase family protein [Burkholderiales bacterium]|nr:amidohydrolase family protein [Burkholderiales bacterium]